jgi:hypothetical protein
MQREPITLGQYLGSQDGVFKKTGVRGWLQGFFGCSHKDLSRPFSREGETYRMCLMCGARRQFVASMWEMKGPFYFGAVQNTEVVSTGIKRIRPRPKLVKNIA